MPGDFAIGEARKAIRRGLNAMIFSDNVALSEEATLKREAHELGRLVMGPDCGTAILGGVPLAFANSVPRGDIGIIGEHSLLPGNRRLDWPVAGRCHDMVCRWLGAHFSVHLSRSGVAGRQGMAHAAPEFSPGH